MSWLLVSPVRMFSFKFERFGWRGNELRYLFAVVALVLLGLLKGAAIPVIILLYIIVSTVRWIGGRKSVKP